MRQCDEFILDVLSLRRLQSAASVAKHFNIKIERVREICQSIKDADICYSGEKTYDILLHYPHR